MSLDIQPVLENDLIIIKPLQEDHFEALYEVVKDPLIWEQHPSRNRYRREVYTSFFKDAMDSKGALIVFNKVDNQVIGSSRYKFINQAEDAIEIGWSFLSRKYWGGTYNRSVKTLMIDHVFESIDKVVFYIGTENLRSQKAVEKFGGVQISQADYPEIVKKDQVDFTYLITKRTWKNTGIIHDN